MRIDKVKQTLRKVNALIENLDSQGSTSAIERDLLRRYLTDIYEEVALLSPVQTEVTTAKQEEVVQPEPEAATVTKANPVAEPVPVAKTISQSVEEKEPISPIDQQTTYYDAEAAEVKGDTVETPVADASINTFSDNAKYFPPEAEVEVEKPDSRPLHAVTQEAEAQFDVAVDQSRFDAVFQIEEGANLAAKYASGRIDKIDNAMGINQRLLIVNELFGGDMQAFNGALTVLNEVNTFEEAQTYLTQGPATALGWDSAAKVPIARDFVRIVRRRFH